MDSNTNRNSFCEGLDRPGVHIQNIRFGTCGRFVPWSARTAYNGGYVRPSTSAVVTPNNPVGRHRITRHGPPLADSDGVSHRRATHTRTTYRPSAHAAPAQARITAAVPLTWLAAVLSAP